MSVLDNAVSDAIKKVKKKATILRLLSDLDNVVFTIYTNKAADEVIIKAKIKGDENELE